MDEVKIDKSFVRDCAVDAHDDAIVRSITELARRLGIEIVAEGVEDETTLGHLAALGCHFVQGYFVSKALDGSDLARWVRARNSTAIGAAAAT